MYTEFSSLPPEPSPEQLEASLLQLAQGLGAAARAWRTGTRVTLIDPERFVHSINAALAGLNERVRHQDELRAFGAETFADFSGRDDIVVTLINILKGLFLS